jgi:hypothetical protein
VPAVIAHLRFRDSAMRKFIIRIASKQKIFQVRFRPSAEELNRIGLDVAQLLSRDAAAALPDIVPFLVHSNFSLRLGAVEAIERIGPGAKSAATNLFYVISSDPFPFVRTKALQALDRLGLSTAEAFPAVTNALSSSDRTVRAAAIKWLMGRGVKPSKLAPVMTFLLRDPDPIVKTLALRELSWMHNDGTNAIPLIEKLKDDSDLQVRLAARGTLEKLTGKHIPRGSNEDAVYEYNFANAGLQQVVQEYGSLVEHQVRIRDYVVTAGVQIYTVGSITKTEAIALIESALQAQLGLAIQKSESGGLVVQRAYGNVR